MAKANSIELPGCEPIPILYEDRTVITVDKPQGRSPAKKAVRFTAK